MKKTASKSKSRVAPKKVSRAPQKKNLVHHYVSQRDGFFVAHPNMRILLGIFIVSVAIFIGVWWWAEMQVMNYTAQMEAEAYYTGY